MSVQRPGDGPAARRPAPVPTSAQQLAFPHDRPRPYHLMLRTWSYAWWKPVLGVVLGVLWFLLGAALVYAITAAVYSVFEPGPWVHDFTSSFDVKGNVSPKVLLGTNLALGSLIPATWFLIRYVHRMRPRWLASVLPRMRWTFLFACLGLAVIALFVQIFVAAALPSSGSGDTSLSGSLNTFTTATAISAVVVLLTTPLQAAGEEYLFRGYLLMAVGSLFSSKWVAIVVTAVIFALAHGSQNVPLFFDRLAFGLIAAWLVTHTGGIEAGIALARAEQLPGVRAGAGLRRPHRDAERQRVELVADPGDRRAVGRLHRPGRPGGPVDGAAQHHRAAARRARAEHRTGGRDRLT